ncbi:MULTISPECIES: alpha-amylase family protein [Olivibacter]|jgi:maltose alpha-D-glucosyltransferase/alpha-amylase|uniref:Alpha-amylase family protein n=3 Tax=Olivibacter TaxID=376469 RepID=A0ABV6HKT4_9SPHI|nr:MULTISPECIES: alpha-amylase family protein [Olivibacter]MDX3914154.1 alpha-amylase family protein [Pseudosphingobacterium sp.]QEL02293.1 trehalose synthase [Olivibacter sp. LS-1]
MKDLCSQHWLKEAVIYSLDVRSFKDADHNGLGDIQGLISKLDYLQYLGINCIWLVPFYSSDEKDGGYDVVNYYTVDTRLGTLQDFEVLVKSAAKRNIKIIIDLVVNHTSNRHPWFLEAISDRGSRFHDFYIWKDEKPENDKEDLVFKTVEESNWEYNHQVNRYYYHTFYHFQPDLNVSNPAVQEEILRILNFWMQFGIFGFRIDAVPHILKNKGDERFEGNPYDVLDRWKEAVLKINKDAILIGEADVEPEDYPRFFNKGKKLDGLFNFFLNNYLFLALAEHCAKPLINAFKRLPFSNGHGQYLNFLRNHDELDLERLTNDERARVMEVFAPCPFMRIYDRGIRRRLPPMLNNNRMHICLSMNLLLTLPGSPVIRYGEEIGMGDDLDLQERQSVRTAMQWDDTFNGGFSSVSPPELKWTVIDGGVYGYQNINVSKEMDDEFSILCQTKKIIASRKEYKLAFCSSFQILKNDHPQIFIYRYDLNDYGILIINNFSYTNADVEIDLTKEKPVLTCVLGSPLSMKESAGKINLILSPYSYLWYKLSKLE